MDTQADREVLTEATTPSFESYGGTAPECYERYFVPAIGAPLAAELVAAAALRPGERVLDVACGTGIVARLAAEHIGPSGTVAGVDINPGMLAVARAATPPEALIDWHQAPADALPLPDEAFDVVTCQMGLQFFPDQVAALREMHRVLAPGGRVILNVPGPTPEMFGVLAEALERHVKSGLAPFVRQVFSLHDTQQLQDLITTAGFTDATAEPMPIALVLPPAPDFLWQYVHSTPLAAPLAEADEPARAALERDIVERWKRFERDDQLTLELRVVTATARTN
jgi:ubiquinone/menaquinone biosynthesis C-methylase UbiE